jgi:hypothetical protein
MAPSKEGCRVTAECVIESVRPSEESLSPASWRRITPGWAGQRTKPARRTEGEIMSDVLEEDRSERTQL